MSKEIKSFRVVQDTLGDEFINVFKRFIGDSLPSPSEMETKLFAHVGDAEHRRAIAQAMFEARWLYRCGLALLVKDEAQSAHVRAQVFLYGTVCEGLLSDWIGYAITNNLMKGESFKYAKLPHRTDPIDKKYERAARDGKPYQHLHSFHNLIHIAVDEGLIEEPLAAKLHELRIDRNKIHSRAAASAENGLIYIKSGKKIL